MKLTVYSDVNAVGLGHPDSSRNKVADLAVEVVIFVLFNHLQTQFAPDWEQTAGFSRDAGLDYNLWVKPQRDTRKGKKKGRKMD